MIFDYVTGPPGTLQYPIYGHLILVNEIGYLFILLAMLPAILTCLLQNRLDTKATNILIFLSAIVAYTGAYISSCRWLDDLFVNLAHSYNLFHHGRFSVSPSHMVNGTVEFIYYLLLTPFAETKASLIIADYAFGFLIGALHLWLFSKLLRPFQPMSRLVAMLAFSITIPLIQTFSGGYGNGMVSLVTFIGILAVIKKRIPLIYLSCALLPMLRPDALLYSVSLVLADLIANKRLRPIWWLPTVFSVALYFLFVKMLYGYWVPTPAMLKSVSLHELVSSLPDFPTYLFKDFFANPFHLIYVTLLILFPFFKAPSGVVLTKRNGLAWIISMVPVFIFFVVSTFHGYNPTSKRYFVGFELAYTVTALISLATITEFLISQTVIASLQKYWKKPVMGIALSCCLLATVANMVSKSLKINDGQSIGIQMGSWDLKRLSTLAFAGQYCASVVPQGWRIASTEMDTFGVFSEREMVDLWGYSNRDIAGAKTISRFGIKNNPNAFLDSNVEIFWLRTIGIGDSQRPEYRIGTNNRQLLPIIFAQFPNLSKFINQAGDLNQVFQKYDVVRVAHGGQYITVFLVRKDLTSQFRATLERKGHKLIGASPFNLRLLQAVYSMQRS